MVKPKNTIGKIAGLNTNNEKIANDDQIAKFVQEYGESIRVQDPKEAFVDPQIKNLSLQLANSISESSQGTILDIGCGKGIILQRLADIDEFKTREWFYIGVDYPEKTQEVLRLAAELEVHRRVDVIAPDILYADWISSEETENPILVIIRNVFHELNIEETAKCIYTLRTRLSKKDTILIQDLLVFPIVERGNVCWDVNAFKQMLISCGFKCTMVTEPTTRGNGWFSAYVKVSNHSRISLSNIHAEVLNARLAQFKRWQDLDTLIAGKTKPRLAPIARIDLDLQRASLQAQLNEAGASGVLPLDKKDQARVFYQTFSSILENFNVENLLGRKSELNLSPYFRDRARHQDSLEQFLLDDTNIAIIQGHALMGKSVLTAEVLARRAHRRQPMIIDVQDTSSVWSLIERYLGALGCNISYEILSKLKSARLYDAVDPLSALVYRTACHSVVVFDHFEALLDPEGCLIDPEIKTFLIMLARAPKAKVIITTRRQPDFCFLPPGTKINDKQMPVSKLPKNEKHVINILNDIVDLASLGISEYPEGLITAIGGHPFLAVTAAQIIKKEGPSSLDDKEFLEILRLFLREELLKRIATDEAMATIDLASKVRIPIPLRMFEVLAGKQSVKDAIELGLIYRSYDYSRGDLFTGIGILRDSMDVNYRGLSSDSTTDTAVDARLRQLHERIANYYEKLYRQDHDPRWIRELHYHTVAAGNMERITQFGILYKSELFAAGEYWFRLKKYDAAFDIFKAAKDLDFTSYRLDMRIAACMMRIGRIAEGEKLYEELIKSHPTFNGIKSSFIDSLLFIKRYSDAYKKLEEYQYKMRDNTYVANQYGRAYFGLRMYRRAIEAFDYKCKNDPDEFGYWWLARAYQYVGEQNMVGSVLEKGLIIFSQSERLSLSYAAHLLRLNTAKDRKKTIMLLRSLHTLSPLNGGILQQLCKALCLDGNSYEARGLAAQFNDKITPERYRIPMWIEVYIAEGKYEDALSLLREIPNDDEHLVGLVKKTYLRWSKSRDSDKDRQDIAHRGLGIPISADLNNNIPILVLSLRLAHLSNNEKAAKDIAAEIKKINPAFAQTIQEVETPYFEDEPY